MNPSPSLAGLSDIEALDRVPLEQRDLPSSTYELLQRSAQRHGQRIALSCLLHGSAAEGPLRISYAELFARIVASFGKDVAFNIKPKQLLKTEPLVALNRIQVQLSSMYPEKGGYVLVDFSEPLDDELQAVLVYTQDLPRVMALCVEAGIYAAPAYESLRDAEAE